MMLIDKAELAQIARELVCIARDQRLGHKRDCLCTFTVCKFLSFKVLLGRLERRSAILCASQFREKPKRKLLLI